MKLITAILFVLLLLQCNLIGSQESGNRMISNVQRDIIFNFIQNDTNFKDKVVVYPYLSTRTFRDFEGDAAELVKLGFKKTDLFSEETDQFIFENGCLNPIVICIDTVAKYEKLANSILELFESKRENCIIGDSTRITIENIDKYSISGFIASIYMKRMCEFKRPIISTNGKYAIFEYFFQCGWLCGKGAVLLLENKGNKWAIKKSLLLTES